MIYDSSLAYSNVHNDFDAETLAHSNVHDDSDAESICSNDPIDLEQLELEHQRTCLRTWDDSCGWLGDIAMICLKLVRSLSSLLVLIPVIDRA